MMPKKKKESEDNDLEILWDVVPESSSVTMIDIREHSKMIEALRKKDSTIQPIQLEVGDIVNTKVGVGFTRKSDDFLDSMMKGKLDQEIAELQLLFPNAYFVVDKSVADIRKMIFSRYRKAGRRKAIWSAFVGFVASCNARKPPIPIQFLGSKGMIADVVVRTIEKLDDGKDRRINSFIRPRPKAKDRCVYILTGFDGISKKRAKHLLDFYGSLKNVLDGFYSLLVSDEDLIRFLGLNKRVIEKAVISLEANQPKPF